jgi:hypothetical protein
MTRVYVIGDCHTSRVNAIHEEMNAPRNFIAPKVWGDDRRIEDTSTHLRFWGIEGMQAWNMKLDQLHAENTLSSAAEDFPGIAGITDNLELRFNFNEVEDADIVMPWVGYIDCRNFIPKYRNPEEAVDNYIDQVFKFFKTSKVRFIEPMPQFEFLGTYNYNEGYTYEDKTYWNDLFISYLRKRSSELGLMDPINQSVIYEAVGHKPFSTKVARFGGEYHDYTIVDGLRGQFSKNIYEAFIPLIQETVDFYERKENGGM